MCAIERVNKSTHLEAMNAGAVQKRTTRAAAKIVLISREKLRLAPFPRI
jgi:hypothetical protein